MDTSRIVVACVSTNGKYADEYVYRLRRAVARNLELPHDFICISDRDIPDVTTHRPLEPRLVGWWFKTTLFADQPYGIPNGTTVLYLDLDVVITGRLEPFLADDAPFRIWRRGAHHRFNSSVFRITAGSHPHLWTEALPVLGLRRMQHMDGSDGDQEWMSRMLPDAPAFPAGLVRSYRNDCTEALPEGTAVVAFHGTPKPHEVQLPWVTECWT